MTAVDSHGEMFVVYSPSSLQLAKFKAFITNFSNSFNSSWREEDVYARMHPLATFERTTRNVSFGFKIFSESKDSALENYENLETFLTMLYPTYAHGATKIPDNASRLLPPIIAVKFRNLISAIEPTAQRPVSGHGDVSDFLFGYIKNLSIETIFDSGFLFLHPEDETGVNKELMLPKELEISFDFTVLHNAKLGPENPETIETYGVSADERHPQQSSHEQYARMIDAEAHAAQQGPDVATSIPISSAEQLTQDTAARNYAQHQVLHRHRRQVRRKAERAAEKAFEQVDTFLGGHGSDDGKK